MIENEAYILAAGRQARYGLNESKLMASVEGLPAITYILKTVMSQFPEEFIAVITSELFQDFNDFISHKYQKIRLIIDDQPGSGSAKSLIKSLPWSTDKVFVTEGNIFYDSSLIKDMYEIFNKIGVIAALSVTPKHEIAPTHRVVQITPKIDLTKRIIHSSTQIYRNVGAYFMLSSIDKFLNSGSKDIIDCLALLVANNFDIAINIYSGSYLHLMIKEDVRKWNNFFGN